MEEPLPFAVRRRCMTVSTRLFGVTALFAVMLMSGCTSSGPIETARHETPSSAASSYEPSKAPTKRVAPSGIPFTVHTHCGVESALIEGAWWHAKPPLHNMRRNGPPAGWGDPLQRGRLTVQSADRAVFEAAGQKVVFVPAPDNDPVRICD
jgi:hypothetical protein